MRILILGATGMLGHRLCQLLSEHTDVWATSRMEAPAHPMLGTLQRAG